MDGQILPLVFSGASQVSSPTRSPEEPMGLSSPARSPGAQVRVDPTASGADGAVGSMSGWGSGPVWPAVLVPQQAETAGSVESLV